MSCTTTLYLQFDTEGRGPGWSEGASWVFVMVPRSVVSSRIWRKKNTTKSHWIRSVDEAAANAPTSEQGITRPATIPPPPPTSPPQSDRQKTKIYPDLTNFEENSHVDEVGSCEYPLEVEVATVSRHHGVSQTCCFVGMITITITTVITRMMPFQWMWTRML